MIYTCYSYLTDEELLRCAHQSEDQLVRELMVRLAHHMERSTKAPIYTKYVEDRPVQILK